MEIVFNSYSNLKTNSRNEIVSRSHLIDFFFIKSSLVTSITFNIGTVGQKLDLQKMVFWAYHITSKGLPGTINLYTVSQIYDLWCYEYVV